MRPFYERGAAMADPAALAARLEGFEAIDWKRRNNAGLAARGIPRTGNLGEQPAATGSTCRVPGQVGPAPSHASGGGSQREACNVTKKVSVMVCDCGGDRRDRGSGHAGPPPVAEGGRRG